MPIINPGTLPSNGDNAVAENIDDPINAILAVVNGHLDDDNISSVNGSKIVAGTIPTSAFSSAANLGWIDIASALSYGANLGGKEYTLTASADLTSIIPAGAKIKVTRGTTPPTQSMAFAAASSQYATKSSPTGISFTGPFSCEAWVYLNSYTGTTQWLASRSDAGGTSGGWDFRLQATGQLMIEYGTTTNFTNFATYQSVPLKRWTHCAGVVTSVSSKTAVMYINGVAVPSLSVNSASTTLTQASVDLRLGAASATPANTYFDGYLSEVRVWSTNITSSAIVSNMGINLTGLEANLVALFKGNGNFNDGTANGNNLTGNGGAIATQAANPYNSIEYGVVTKVSYSNPTTTITVFTGTDYNIPNLTFTTPQFSLLKTPFGFPSATTKWLTETLILTNESVAIGSFDAWNDSHVMLSIPSGEWEYGWAGAPDGGGTSSSVMDFYFGLGISGAAADPRTVGQGLIGPVTTFVTGQNYTNAPLSLTTQTAYYLKGMSHSAGGTVSWNTWNVGTARAEYTRIFAKCAYI